MDRKTIDKSARAIAVGQVAEALEEAIEKKGKWALQSTHEILGLVTEEHHELVEAVRVGTPHHIKSELKDIAVAAIFALACMNEKTVDW